MFKFKRRYNKLYTISIQDREGFYMENISIIIHRGIFKSTIDIITNHIINNKNICETTIEDAKASDLGEIYEKLKAKRNSDTDDAVRGFCGKDMAKIDEIFTVMSILTNTTWYY